MAASWGRQLRLPASRVVRMLQGGDCHGWSVSFRQANECGDQYRRWCTPVGVSNRSNGHAPTSSSNGSEDVHRLLLRVSSLRCQRHPQSLGILAKDGPTA